MTLDSGYPNKYRRNDFELNMKYLFDLNKFLKVICVKSIFR